METQLMMPSPAVDFNFDSASTSPFVTAPSSPKYFGTFYYTAPPSPTPNIPTAAAGCPHSTTPFTPEDTKQTNDDDELVEEVDDDDGGGDFAFDFSGQLERPFISAADELFHGGKIKPLKPSPRLHFSNGSPKSILSPRSKKKDLNPFSEAFKQTPKAQSQNPSQRERGTRKVSDIISDEENNQKSSTNQSSSTITWYNKWNLKNLLLFRSTSEGSATTSKDRLKKYAMIKKDVNTSSFKSVDSGGRVAVGGSKRRMKRKVSAHEIHYTANRAVAEEMRRKTTLPYKSGLLGCLGFDNSGGSVRGVNSVMR